MGGEDRGADPERQHEEGSQAWLHITATGKILKIFIPKFIPSCSGGRPRLRYFLKSP